MPFYEYECSQCRFYVEIMQKVSDPRLKKCPSCKKSAMQRLISAPVFRLKGSGWYETDFKSDKEKKRNLAGADKDLAPAEAAVKADSKTESKAESKTETKAESPGAGKEAGSKAEPAAKAPADRPRMRRTTPTKSSARRPAARTKTASGRGKKR